MLTGVDSELEDDGTGKPNTASGVRKAAAEARRIQAQQQGEYDTKMTELDAWNAASAEEKAGGFHAWRALQQGKKPIGTSIPEGAGGTYSPDDDYNQPI